MLEDTDSLVAAQLITCFAWKKIKFISQKKQNKFQTLHMKYAKSIKPSLGFRWEFINL